MGLTGEEWLAKWAKSEIIMQRNKNKEWFQFHRESGIKLKRTWLSWATVAMETGAISEHQPGFHRRKVLIQMTASSLPQTSPPFPVLFKERGDISPRDRGEAKPLWAVGVVLEASKCPVPVASGWGHVEGLWPSSETGWVGEGPASSWSPSGEAEQRPTFQSVSTAKRKVSEFS